MNLDTLDLVIVIVFLIGIAAWGIIAGGKQKTHTDYFLGAHKVPWWLISFSIIAAETSTLTFISIPGLAYLTNLNFLQVTLGYLTGRIFVTFFLLPEYYRGEISTAYSFLENRFGLKTRKFASVVFLFTRTAADGVRLFATAIPIKLLLNIDYHWAIGIVAVISLVYTYTGGVKGVIWVDAFQMFLYLGGVIVSIIFIIDSSAGGAGELFTRLLNDGKLQIFNSGFEGGIREFFNTPYSLIAGITGGAFLSMASHGTDQLIIQRLLSAGSLKKSQKALLLTGFVIVIQFALFLTLGALLYDYYAGKQFARSDEIFPLFILNELPSGVSGLLIAGMFAAALSTLAGSISSMASSTMFDLILTGKRGKEMSEEKKLKYSRILTLVWALVLIQSAALFMNSDRAVVEIALSIASFTYGGLLGTFLLGIFVKKARQEDALAAFTAGILVMVSVILLKLVAWTWFTLIGVMVTMLTGYLLSTLTDQRKE